MLPHVAATPLLHSQARTWKAGGADDSRRRVQAQQLMQSAAVSQGCRVSQSRQWLSKIGCQVLVKVSNCCIKRSTPLRAAPRQHCVCQHIWRTFAAQQISSTCIARRAPWRAVPGQLPLASRSSDLASKACRQLMRLLHQKERALEGSATSAIFASRSSTSVTSLR